MSNNSSYARKQATRGDRRRYLCEHIVSITQAHIDSFPVSHATPPVPLFNIGVVVNLLLNGTAQRCWHRYRARRKQRVLWAVGVVEKHRQLQLEKRKLQAEKERWLGGLLW